jgi:hypothetical protein
MVTKYNIGDVVTFKLTSGDEILARFNEETTTEYTLNKPMALLNTPNGGLGMMAVPVSSNPSDTIVLNKHAVAMHCRCDAELSKLYLEKTTGLKLSTSGLI